MKKCTNCNINYNTSENFCPLCQNKLIGDCEVLVFPTKIRLASHMLFKILLFITLTISIICGFIELCITNHLKYSLFVIGGLFTNLVVVYHILKNRHNILRFIGKTGVIFIIIALIWYIVTKSMIITNYVIPSICIFELLFNLITFIVLRNKYIINYLSLILINIFILIVPIFLIIFKCTSFNLISYISLVFALIILIGLFIFYFDEIIEELKKLFNL